MRLVAHSSALTFWTEPAHRHVSGRQPHRRAAIPRVGISSSAGDTMGNVRLGPCWLPSRRRSPRRRWTTSATADLCPLTAGAAEAQSAATGRLRSVRDGVYLGQCGERRSWLSPTVTGGWPSAIYVVDSQWARK